MIKWYTTICYFGTKIHKNNVTKYINNNEFNQFIKKHIQNNFDSFTISDNIGYWNGEKELTKCLTIIHNNDNETINKLINIAKKYSKKYYQDEVLINTVKSSKISINLNKF